jgi:hypothetical protein
MKGKNTEMAIRRTSEGDMEGLQKTGGKKIKLRRFIQDEQKFTMHVHYELENRLTLNTDVLNLAQHT